MPPNIRSIVANSGTLSVAGITSSALVTVDSLFSNGNVDVGTGGLLTVTGSGSYSAGDADPVANPAAVTVTQGGVNILGGGLYVGGAGAAIVGGLAVTGTGSYTGLLTVSAGLTVGDGNVEISKGRVQITATAGNGEDTLAVSTTGEK